MIRPNVGFVHDLQPSLHPQTTNYATLFQGIAPRNAGEHQLKPCTADRAEGSPPRMRGTPNIGKYKIMLPGITPAYARNTIPPLYFEFSRRDHPRVCGEHAVPLKANRPRLGSPPRMRGTRPRPLSANKRTGITPAYAGNTNTPYSDVNRLEDHPRVCGEHTLSQRRRTPHAGSPPRMRGTPVLGKKAQHYSGITPAYAGNTFNRSRRTSGFRDHPRVCGEHFSFPLY